MPAPSGSVGRVGPWRIALFACIFFGLAVTEEVSINVLPLTLKRITGGILLQFDLPFSVPWLAPEGRVSIGSAFVIGLVLALNPFFGFIAQPLVGAFGNDFRVSWLIAIVVGVANILVMLTIRDPRERQGKD